MLGTLPPQTRNLPGTGTFVKGPDYFTFPPGSSFPRRFTFWRFAHLDHSAVSPPGHANRLRLTPSNTNLTSFASFDPLAGQTFADRRQIDTLFEYNVILQFSPSSAGDEEAGVTVFLSQDSHADIGVAQPTSVSAPRVRVHRLRS